MADEPMNDNDNTSMQQAGDADISYIDRLVSDLGLDSESEAEEYVPPDSDEEYSEDEYEYDTDEESSLDLTPFEVMGDAKDMSEEAKEELVWRYDKEESFSNWTIEVIVEGKRSSSASSQVYHVHRVTLAGGVRKCGYFEVLFNSDRYQECTDKTSRVEVPEDWANTFPDFLDYLYAPITECNCVITFENVLSLRFLADYFLVPKLVEATKEFMIKDMGNLDHMEKYLLQLKSYDDYSKEVFAYAAAVCVAMRTSIKVDSTLLYCLPPYVFYRVAVISSRSSEEKNYICQLALSYIKHHIDRFDEMIFFSVLAGDLQFPEDEVQAGLVAYELLKIMNETGWEKEAPYYPGNRFRIQNRCVDAYSKYLALEDVNLSSIDFTELFQNIPLKLASELLKEAVKSKRELAKDFADVKSKLQTVMDTITNIDGELDDDN